MKTRVVTLMWGEAWDKYGKRFAETFVKFWPDSVDLVIVTDKYHMVPRSKQYMLNCLPGYEEFMKHWSGDPRAKGFMRPHGTKVDRHGRSFRFDAVMWMPQAITPAAALDGLEDGDILVWFDADVETLKPVRYGWLEELVGDADVVCLQRQNSHSEIGFYGIRISDKTRAFIRMFGDIYTSDNVFDLREWHSAFVFDYALSCFPDIKVKNLSPVGNGVSHVWPNTPLAEFTEHYKGNRKEARNART